MMKFVIAPSLERTAILKIASWLWSQNDIRALIERNSFPRFNFETIVNWKKIEDKVLEKVSNLQLPEAQKEKIDGVVRAVGLEILTWIQNYFDSFDVVRVPSEFFLTQLGTIDKQRSAERLIKDETISIEQRYKLACIASLKDYVPELWNKLPENCRHKYYKSHYLATEIPDCFFSVFFADSLKGKFYNTALCYGRSFYVQQFKEAIINGNLVAAKYFYRKLTLDDPKFSILETTENMIGDVLFTRNVVEVLCFLLSKLDEEQQITLLRSCNGLIDVLRRMLDWPWQSFFIQTITLMHGFISQSFYEELVQRIIYNVIDGYKAICYRDTFTKLCMQMPGEERRHVLHKVCASDSLLANLFKIKDTESIKLMFLDTNPELKKEFIASSNGISICCKLMARDEWNLLELFILDCITTKDELVKFKENFHGIVRSALKITDAWDKFVCLLENLICKNDKRKSEEEMSTNSVKKLCSI